MRSRSRLRWILLLLIVASPFVAVSGRDVRAVRTAGGPALASGGALSAQGFSVSVTDWHDPLCAANRQRYTIVVRNDSVTALTGVRRRDANHVIGRCNG